MASKRDTRELILDAAANRFAHSGAKAVSVREVARAAEVSPSVVQYHFASKAALWRGMIVQAARDDGTRLSTFLDLAKTVAVDGSMSRTETDALVRLFISQSLSQYRNHTVLWQACLIEQIRQGRAL